MNDEAEPVKAEASYLEQLVGCIATHVLCVQNEDIRSGKGAENVG